MVKDFCENRIWFTFVDASLKKIERDNAIRAIRDDVIETVTRDYPTKSESAIDAAFSRLTKKIFRFVCSLYYLKFKISISLFQRLFF